jgi:ankyrin repeat protein
MIIKKYSVLIALVLLSGYVLGMERSTRKYPLISTEVSGPCTLKQKYKKIEGGIVDLKKLPLPLTALCFNTLLDSGATKESLWTSIDAYQPLPELLKMVSSVKDANYKNEELVLTLFKLFFNQVCELSPENLNEHLLEAAFVGDEYGVKLLLAKGAQLTKETAKSLVYALRGGNIAITNLLLDSVRDDLSKNKTLMEIVEEQNLGSNKLLHQQEDCLKRAIELSNVHLIDFLLQNGISPFYDSEDEREGAPFVAVLLKMREDPDQAIEILKRFLPYETTDRATVLTSLLRAINWNDEEKLIDEVISAILGVGVDINGRDHTGTTPLHYAVDAGLLIIVRLLLAFGADLTIADFDRETPLMLAERLIETPDDPDLCPILKEIAEALKAHAAII